MNKAVELEDLVLKHYRVERYKGKMIAIEDPNGNYKAASAEQIERVLTFPGPIRRADHIYYRRKPTGKWYPMIRRS